MYSNAPNDCSKEMFRVVGKWQDFTDIVLQKVVVVEDEDVGRWAGRYAPGDE